jgi:voltage-gated potassium channel
MNPLQELYQRLSRAFVLLMIVLGLGTLGLFAMGGGKWTLEECLYMTVITLSTVGYGEVVPVSDVPHARIFLIFLILFGMGVILYFASAVVAIFVEGDLRQLWRKRSMQKKIEKLSSHVIVCGAGTTGGHVMKEMSATRTPFVVIERDESKIERFRKRNKNLGELLFIVGDATEQNLLLDAGIERARGIIVALPDDKDCLIVTVTARQMRRDLRVVSKAHEPEYVRRIRQAGANAVVSPNQIGGMRLSSEMIRPTVVQFLDLMLRDKEKNLRIEQIEIDGKSTIVGKKLAESHIRRDTNLLVIAAQNSLTGEYVYNPGPEFVVDKGTVLIVLGSTDDVIKIRDEYGVVQT